MQTEHISLPARAQTGFSLVEVAIVTAIVLTIAMLGVPAIGTYLIENKVPKVGESLQRMMMRLQVSAQGGGLTPYAGIDNVAVAHAFRDSTVLEVAPGGAIVHGLSRQRRPGFGALTVAPASLEGAGAGSAFSLTLRNVNHAACPALASVLQGVSSVIQIEGGKGRVTVKDLTANPARGYSAIRAASACGDGDVNHFTFIAR